MHYLLAKLRNKIFLIVLSFYRRFAKTKEIIIFTSFPDYSDNALALSDYLWTYERWRYIVYWIVDNPSTYQKELGYTGLKFVGKRNRFGMVPIKTIKAHMQSKYVFATHGFLIPQEQAKAEQKYYLLWHGCGFKTKLQGSHYTLFDMGLVPGSLFVGSKSKYWNVPATKILAKGYPRYDWMLHPSEEACKYYSSLKGVYDKVIFWLPTVRNSISTKEYPEGIIRQFPILGTENEWAVMNNFLVSNNTLLIVKLHNSQKKYDISFDHYSNIKVVDNLTFVKAGIKMYELFSMTDALITDYSSVSFDYMVVDKPIGYTLDDFKLYKSTRGFIFDNPLDYMPGHHIYNMQDLQGFVIDIKQGKDEYQQKREIVRKQAVTISETSYCKEILTSLGII